MRGPSVNKSNQTFVDGETLKNAIKINEKSMFVFCYGLGTSNYYYRKVRLECFYILAKFESKQLKSL